MENISLSERARLEALLKRKLTGIPKLHLPTLTLDDIVNQTAAATHLPNIPADIQLDYFLTFRAYIARNHDKPLKNAEEQQLRLTRAIFYYRLDEMHQFQRYYDSGRWNIAMFVAILTHDAHIHDDHNHLSRQLQSNNPNANSNSNGEGLSFHLQTDAKRFIVAFLEAVMEHHNSPHIFSKRDSFIKLWKRSDFDMFVLKASQNRFMKGLMKKSKAEWQTELEIQRQKLGEAEYEKRIGPMIGVLFPGLRPERKLEEQIGMDSQPARVNMEAKKEEEQMLQESGLALDFQDLAVRLKRPLDGNTESSYLDAWKRLRLTTQFSQEARPGSNVNWFDGTPGELSKQERSVDAGELQLRPAKRTGVNNTYEGRDKDENALLKALQVPFPYGDKGMDKSKVEGKTCDEYSKTVLDISLGLWAVKIIKPHEMIGMLLELFA